MPWRGRWSPTRPRPGPTARPGRYEANFARERMIDIAARRLGLDPAELRRRNLVAAEQMPYETGTQTDGHPVSLRQRRLPAAARRGLERFDYEAMVAWRDAKPSDRGGAGIGLGFFVEKSGDRRLGVRAGRSRQRGPARGPRGAAPRSARASRPCWPRSAPRRLGVPLRGHRRGPPRRHRRRPRRDGLLRQPRHGDGRGCGQRGVRSAAARASSTRPAEMLEAAPDGPRDPRGQACRCGDQPTGASPWPRSRRPRNRRRRSAEGRNPACARRPTSTPRR